MAVYPHPWQPKVLIAYSFFGTRLLTPRWFDDREHELIQRHRRIGHYVFWAWAWMRWVGIVQMRLWKRVA